MKFASKVLGMDKLKRQLDGLSSDMLAHSKKAVADATFLLHKEAVESIQENNDGTPALRYKPKRVVAVSHPGDPPNTDTGRLVQSIQMDFQNNGFMGRVGSGLRYAAWLEFGTKRMAARPWLSLAVRKTSKQIGEIFRKALLDALRTRLD